MEENFSFGYWLRRQRLSRDMRQADLAAQLGVAPITLRKIEADERRPSLQLIARIGEALGLSEEERATLARVARADLSPVALPLPEPTLEARHNPPARPTSLAVRHNLPAQPTSLIGREREVGELCAMLGPGGPRLVTLTGPGGTGKTRLALQAGAELLDRFPQGVWLVTLAPVSDPAQLLPAVAQTLGVREMAGRGLGETIGDALRGQALLLILDNFEQIVGAAPHVAALLAAAPLVKAIVTSREALHLAGEHLFPVQPLALPDRAEQPEPLRLSQYEAVRLFVERARAVRPDFVVTAANATVVAEICRRLDGLPLAIELAAAGARLFAPEALLGRLDRRLQLLTGGPRDQPARQQTLRGAIEWSYALLTGEEQAFFRQLGVFVGGASLDGAAAVGGRAEGETIDLLAALVDKSLLRQAEGPDGEPRFTMLETIREYALEQLGLGGEEEAARERHAAYFLGLAERAEPQLRDSHSQAWMALLAADHDNMRAALASLHGRGASEHMIRLCYALWRYWYDRGHWAEGRQALELVLNGETLTALPPWLQARALVFGGIFLSRQSEFARSRALLERSRALFRQAGDVGGQVDAMYGLAIVEHGVSDYVAASAVTSEALELSRAAGDEYRTALLIDWLSYSTYVQGDVERAEALGQEALALFRRLGLQDRVGVALAELGSIASGRGDDARAVELLEESIALNRRFNRPFELSAALNYLGHVLKKQGDAARALGLFHEGLDLRRRLGDRRGLIAPLIGLVVTTYTLGDRETSLAHMREAMALARDLSYKQGHAWILSILAEVAALGGEMELAARFLGAAAAYSQANGVPYWPDEQRVIDGVAAIVRAALGESGFAAARAAGQAMSLDEALALVEAPFGAARQAGGG